MVDGGETVRFNDGCCYGKIINIFTINIVKYNNWPPLHELASWPRFYAEINLNARRNLQFFCFVLGLPCRSTLAIQRWLSVGLIGYFNKQHLLL